MEVNQSAYVLRAMQSLKEEGSWCGETHVQKAMYLCQELLGTPSDLKYILYKHGPYSFQLSDLIQSLIPDDLVQLIARPPYGPTLAITEQAKAIAKLAETNKKFSVGISRLSKELSSKNVAELEKLATAVYVKRKGHGEFTVEGRADSMVKLKPHIAVEAAKSAVKAADILEASLAQLA